MKMPSSGDGVSEICHALGSNADLPKGWKIHIVVADVEESASACTASGGKVEIEPRGLVGGQFCVIEGPSGAIAGLYQP
jgi:predicted enzyme related to lactoylglutathione lyase